MLDPYIAADGPAQFLQTLPERRTAGLVLRIIRREGGRCANDTHPVRLLCAHREWPCHSESSNSFNEGASSHCRPQDSGPARTMSQLQQGFESGGMGSSSHFARQQCSGSNVRFGSKADIAECETN